MLSKPVNTALCLDNIGTFCNSGGNTLIFSDSSTTRFMGAGTLVSPYNVQVKIDPSSDNAIQITAGGLFVDKNLSLDVSFSNDLFNT